MGKHYIAQGPCDSVLEGGNEKTQHFLKWWCVQGFDQLSREGHMTLPRVLPNRPPSERVLDALINQPGSDSEPGEDEDED